MFQKVLSIQPQRPEERSEPQSRRFCRAPSSRYHPEARQVARPGYRVGHAPCHSALPRQRLVLNLCMFDVECWVGHPTMLSKAEFHDTTIVVMAKHTAKSDVLAIF